MLIITDKFANKAEFVSARRVFIVHYELAITTTITSSPLQLYCRYLNLLYLSLQLYCRYLNL